MIKSLAPRSRFPKWGTLVKVVGIIDATDEDLNGLVGRLCAKHWRYRTDGSFNFGVPGDVGVVVNRGYEKEPLLFNIYANEFEVIE